MRSRITWTLAGAGLAAAALTSGLLVATNQHRIAPVAEAVPAAPSSTDPPSTSETAVTPVASTSTETAVPLPDAAQVARNLTNAVTAASHGTSVGFVLYDRETGKELSSANPDKAYYTASVVKLLIAIDEVHNDSTGAWELPDADAVEDIVNMIEGSNDGLASAFWGENGGNSIVTRTAKLIGLDHTAPPADPTQWGMAKMSADDVFTTYQFIEDTIPDNVAEPILKAMGNAHNPADDGFDQYFGIPNGLPGMSWQVKQGWMILRNALVLNTTGIVDSRYVVVLLTQQPLISSAKGRTAVTAGIKTLAPVLSKLGT